MTKTKAFRLNTYDRAKLKALSKFYDCSETDIIRIALEKLATKFISDRELQIAIEEVSTSEYRHDKSED